MAARAQITVLAATLAVALAALGLALAAPGRAAVRVGLDAAGALSLTSSRDGQTLFAATGLRPGQQTAGTLRVTNAGSRAAVLGLRLADVAERAGSGGGLLSGSGRLVLTIADATAGGTPVPLWSGHPAQLTEARIAALPAGSARDLVVTAALDPAAGDAYQDASLSLGLTWGAQAAPVAAAPTAAPVPTAPVARVPAPAAPPTPSPAPTPTPTAPHVVIVAATTLGLPPARRCLSRRALRLRVRAPHRAGIESAVVRVGGRTVRTARGRGRRIVPVKVRTAGVHGHRVTVRVDVRTTGRARYRGTRRYRLCG